MCSIDNVLDCTWFETPDVGAMIQGGIMQSLDELLQQATDGLVQVLGFVMVWWMATPSPTVSNCGGFGATNRTTGAPSVPESCGEPTGVIGHIADHTFWIVGVVAVFSLIVAACKIALSRDGKAARDIAGGLVGLLAGSTIVLGGLQILIAAGDAYSMWIIGEAGGEDPATFFLDGLNIADNTLTIVLMLGVVGPAMFLGIIQFILLLARFASLVFLAGLVPVAFAAGMTGGGKSMRDKYLAWMIAFALYKPVAATVWATVIWMLRESMFAMGALEAFIHFLVLNMMILMALFALPAMMRLVTPAVSTVGGGSGGGLFAAVAGGASIASGAVDVGVRRRSESSSSSRTTRGPDANGAQGTAATTAPKATGSTAKGSQAAGAAAKSGKAAASAGAGAATAGVATGVQVGVEAVKAGGKAVQALGEHGAGDTPTGAQGGSK